MKLYQFILPALCEGTGGYCDVRDEKRTADSRQLRSRYRCDQYLPLMDCLDAAHVLL